MSEVMQRAAELAEKNTPGVAVANLGVLLENLFLGTFAAIGWVFGRLWFHGSKLIYAVGLAFADGYKKGAQYTPPPPQPARPVPNQPNLPNQMEQQFGGPLGVQYGPATFAYTEPG
jgi:hypothetical protein